MRTALLSLLIACGDDIDPPRAPDAGIAAELDAAPDAFEQPFCVDYCLGQAPLNLAIFEHCLRQCDGWSDAGVPPWPVDAGASDAQP